jgi:hypothetical protein
MWDWYRVLVAELQTDPLAAATLMCPARTGGKKASGHVDREQEPPDDELPHCKPNPPVYLLNAVQSSPNKPKRVPPGMRRRGVSLSLLLGSKWQRAE